MFDNVPDWVWWVAVIFAAGVIGQFGKSLTLQILGLFSTKKQEPEVPPVLEVGKTEAVLNLKEQKKLKKAELKQAKKEARTQTKLK